MAAQVPAGLQDIRARITELLTTFRTRIETIRANILARVPTGGVTAKGAGFRGGGLLGGGTARGTRTRAPARRTPSRRAPARRAPAGRAQPSPGRGRVIPHVTKPEKYDFTYAGRARARVGVSAEEKYDFTY